MGVKTVSSSGPVPSRATGALTGGSRCDNQAEGGEVVHSHTPDTQCKVCVHNPNVCSVDYYPLVRCHVTGPCSSPASCILALSTLTQQIPVTVRDSRKRLLVCSQDISRGWKRVGLSYRSSEGQGCIVAHVYGSFLPQSAFNPYSPDVAHHIINQLSKLLIRPWYVKPMRAFTGKHPF